MTVSEHMCGCTNHPQGDLLRVQILTPAEYTVFETPPRLTSVERQRFFDTPQSLERLLASFRTPANQIGFVLTLGYFKATKRFFAQAVSRCRCRLCDQAVGVLARGL